MNALNRPTAVQAATAEPAAALGLHPASLFPVGTVLTVIGEVRDWKLGWAGRTQCRLVTSFGDLHIRANRDTLSLDIGNGAWIRTKLLHRHEHDDKGSPYMRVLSAVSTIPSVGETSWVPICLYHRAAGMRKLRLLLSTLEPGLQGLFMSVMIDRRLQRDFFWRPAATDHHCYPGGHFDQSLAAAELANQGQYSDARDRGLATIAGLVWDIGKMADQRLRGDFTRTWPELQPHKTTTLRMKRPLARLALSQPQLAAEVAALLATASEAPTFSISPVPPRTASMRSQVKQAVRKSWGPANPGLNTSTSQGASA
jgi:hypothetical protein